MFPVIELIEPDVYRRKFEPGSEFKQFGQAKHRNIAKEGQGQVKGLVLEQPPATTGDHPVSHPVQCARHFGRKPESKEEPHRGGTVSFGRHK